MGDVSVIPPVDKGHGNAASLLDLDGRALAVDASRDPPALREASERRGLRLAFAADTHLHADFLTAAGLLTRTGHHRVTVLDGGPQDWADTTGHVLQVGK